MSSCESGVTLETKAILGLVLDATFSAKSGGLRTSSGTAITPARRQPKNASTHWGQLGPHSSALSPFVSPRCWRREATLPASSHRSEYDQRW